MIKSYANSETQILYETGFHPRFQSFARVALSKLDMLNAAVNLKSLLIPPNNRLEKLRGDCAGQYSIRINDQWRVCFRWDDGDAWDVEIVDYHCKDHYAFNQSNTPR